MGDFLKLRMAGVAKRSRRPKPAWSKHGLIHVRKGHPHYFQDPCELLDKLWCQWESCTAACDTNHTKTSQTASIPNTPPVDSGGAGPAGSPVCRAELDGSAPRVAPKKKAISEENSPLIADRPFTEPFSWVSWIFSVCQIRKTSFLVPLPKQSRLCVVLPGSALRSQTAHFPFSTTWCDKSDITWLIYPMWLSRIPAPYLVWAIGVWVCVSPWQLHVSRVSVYSART